MDVLLACRNTIKYTYVHALHLFEHRSRAELELFEFQQQDLEQHTERLAGLIECLKVTPAGAHVCANACVCMHVCRWLGCIRGYVCMYVCMCIHARIYNARLVIYMWMSMDRPIDVCINAF